MSFLIPIAGEALAGLGEAGAAAGAGEAAAGAGEAAAGEPSGGRLANFFRGTGGGGGSKSSGRTITMDTERTGLSAATNKELGA